MVIRYRLAETQYQGEDALFSVDPEDGRVVISGLLDREDSTQHRLTLVAETDSSPALVTYRQLNILVLDANDNAPAFDSQTYEAVVSEAAEPHSRVTRVRASDPDFGTNGELRYFIQEDSASSSALFMVGERDGWISTRSSLDREDDSAGNVLLFC